MQGAHWKEKELKITVVVQSPANQASVLVPSDPHPKRFGRSHMKELQICGVLVN